MRTAVRAIAAAGCCAVLAACGTTVPVSQQAAVSTTGGSGLDGLGGTGTTGAAQTTGGTTGSLLPGTTGAGGSTTTGSMSTGGSTGTTTGTVAVPTASVPTAGASHGPATIPTKGRGWDASSVSIGIPTENDTAKAVSALGISFDPGDLPGMAQAAIAAANERGGLFGRKLVAVLHDNSTVAVTSNASAVAATNCSYFTQDHPVAVLLNALPAIDMPPCSHKAGLPDFEASSVLLTTSSYAKNGPYVWTTEMPNVDRLARAYVDRLAAQGFFSAWDATNGKPGKAPVKVGILEPSTPEGTSLVATLSSLLRAKGLAVGATFAYTESLGSYSGDMRSAALKFSAAGVTHVLSIPPIAAALLFFMQASENQRYRPRHGVTTYSLPGQSSSYPANQLHGAMGIGHDPGVDAKSLPPLNAAGKACEAAMKKHGVAIDTPLKASNSLLVCDNINLFVAAAKAGGGLDAPAIGRGMGMVGPGFSPGFTFSSGLTATNHALPGSVRDLAYTPSCSCFAYVGAPHPIP